MSKNESVTVQVRLSANEWEVIRYESRDDIPYAVRMLADRFGHGDLTPIATPRYLWGRRQRMVTATVSRRQRQWLMRAGEGKGVGVGLRGLIAAWKEEIACPSK